MWQEESNRGEDQVFADLHQRLLVFRFWLFTWSRYYPSGGMQDFLKDYPTSAEALAAGDAWCHAEGLAEYHVYDSVDRKVLPAPAGSQFYDYRPRS